jgi:hypothetical protein
MKKLLTAAAILSVISFAGIHVASAHGNYYNRGDYGYCGSYSTDGSTYTKENAEAFEKFRADTKAVQKEIVVKRSELNALLRKDNPNEKRVAELTGNLYDLETELDAKAEQNGIKGRYAYGPGMMHNYGRGYGRHMMDW